MARAKQYAIKVSRSGAARCDGEYSGGTLREAREKARDWAGNGSLPIGARVAVVSFRFGKNDPEDGAVIVREAWFVCACERCGRVQARSAERSPCLHCLGLADGADRAMAIARWIDGGTQ